MFTWICPQCGREVPPSYTDCPDCAAKGKAAPPAPPAAQPPPPAPPIQAAAPPPPAAQYSAPPYQPPPQYYQPPPARAGLPTWLMSIIFALAFGGLVLGGYYAVEYFKRDSSAAAHSGAAADNPPAASSTSDAKGNPLRKQIEVVGVRLTQNKAQKTEVRFLVVNHSGADVQDLAGNVNLQARTSKKDEEPVGTFSFKVPSLGPYESKEETAVVNTKLKVYELPDWQNLDLRVQITSP
jgi:hypothetical protein